MGDEDELLASLELIGVSPGGDERPFTVGVGRPRRDSSGCWFCPTRWHDFDKAKPIYGEDSLQALCLGLALIRARLQDFLGKGGRLLAAEDRHEFSREEFEAYFSKIGSAGPT